MSLRSRFAGLPLSSRLGLAISARIVAEHGGHIGYRCPPDGGTIFTVTLQESSQAPRADQAA